MDKNLVDQTSNSLIVSIYTGYIQSDLSKSQ